MQAGPGKMEMISEADGVKVNNPRKAEGDDLRPWRAGDPEAAR